MADKTKKMQYDIEYAKTHLKRIPLDVRLDKYEEIKAHAAAQGESINGYIKKSIDDRMQRDSSSESDTPTPNE